MAYPKAYRQLAYEIWREDRSQNGLQVQQKLTSMLPDTEIPVDTIWDWRQRDDWEGQWAREVQGASPQMLQRIAAGVAVGAQVAVEYLTNVISDPQSVDKDDLKLMANRIAAARVLIQGEITLIAAAQPKGPKPKERNLSITPNMSNEELLALEAKARSQSPPQ